MVVLQEVSVPGWWEKVLSSQFMSSAIALQETWQVANVLEFRLNLHFKSFLPLVQSIAGIVRDRPGRMLVTVSSNPCLWHHALIFCGN